MIKDNGAAPFAIARAHRPAGVCGRDALGRHVTLDLGHSPITLPVELEPVAF